MASFNGHLASLSTTIQGASVSRVNVDAAVPQKWFDTALFAVRTLTGISGSVAVRVVGAIGGATFVIAGVTAISTATSTIMGTTGGATFGVPRPMFVAFEGTGSVTGFTAQVFMAGEYN